jgi:hypothetical protein
MGKKKGAVQEEVQEEITEEGLTEELISRDDIDIEVMSTMDTEPTVYVKFTGFDDEEDAEDYAQFLAETLPLLLFETTRIQ